MTAVGGGIVVRLVKTWASDEIVQLYHAGGWWKDEYDPASLPNLIRNSFAFAVAIDQQTGRAVGMGRVISDGVSDGYIQDLVVLPACRNKGIGKKIVATLVKSCTDSGISWIGLIAEPATEEFYRPLGFYPMQGHIPLLWKGGRL
jgi:ribosomal protein S18 acetylase RimI-like enzyme